MNRSDHQPGDWPHSRAAGGLSPSGKPQRITLALLLGLLAAAGAYLLWRIDPRDIPFQACTFHAITGWYCPGCGATRATHELLHGRLLAAMRCNALWVVVAPLVVYAGFAEGLRMVRGRGLRRDPLDSSRLWIALALIGLLFGLLRNVPGYPFTLLVPL